MVRTILASYPTPMKTDLYNQASGLTPGLASGFFSQRHFHHWVVSTRLVYYVTIAVMVSNRKEHCSLSSSILEYRDGEMRQLRLLSSLLYHLERVVSFISIRDRLGYSYEVTGNWRHVVVVLVV